ncbi:unnamed protein product [Arabidopsis thaliana]|uniref:Uncharacterized protein n=1 Tax=Arabidopsis thaliana TaxID=3702 RepID=A0A654FMA9_ARATH|nr:unnamed protein product [Arabidopsis thaliana]
MLQNKSFVFVEKLKCNLMKIVAGFDSRRVMKLSRKRGEEGSVSMSIRNLACCDQSEVTFQSGVTPVQFCKKEVALEAVFRTCVIGSDCMMKHDIGNSPVRATAEKKSRGKSKGEFYVMIHSR